MDVSVGVAGATVGAARLGIWHARMTRMMKSRNGFDLMLNNLIQPSYHWK
jgi:hypothetical protein